MPLINSLGALKQLPMSDNIYPIGSGNFGSQTTITGNVKSAVMNNDKTVLYIVGTNENAKPFVSKINIITNTVIWSSYVTLTGPAITQVASTNYSICLGDPNNDSICNVYVGGSMYESVNDNFQSAFIHQYNSSGDKIWTRFRYGTTAGPDNVIYHARTQSIVCDSNENIYAYSTNHGVLPYTYMNQFTKYNTIGDTIWSYGSSYVGISGKMIINNSNNLITLERAPAVPQVATSPIYPRTFQYSYFSIVGIPGLIKSIGHSTLDTNGLDIAINKTLISDTNIYIIGTVSSANGSTTGRYFIAKIDQANNYVFKKYITSTYDIIGKSGSLVVTDYNIYINIAINLNLNLYIKMDTDGNIIWSRNLTGVALNSAVTTLIEPNQINLIGTDITSHPAKFGMPINGSIPRTGTYIINGSTYTYKKINLLTEDVNLNIGGINNTHITLANSNTKSVLSLGVYATWTNINTTSL